MKNEVKITSELIKACKAYKENQQKESYHKKEKEKQGKIIKSILGDKFDDELYIESDEYTGNITYKITISFTADREKIENKGLFDEFYKATQQHKLTVG